MKDIIPKEIVTAINIYTLNYIAWKYLKQKKF